MAMEACLSRPFLLSIYYKHIRLLTNLVSCSYYFVLIINMISPDSVNDIPSRELIVVHISEILMIIKMIL